MKHILVTIIFLFSTATSAATLVYSSPGFDPIATTVANGGTQLQLNFSGIDYSVGAFSIFNITTVPLPGAAWLFGSALLGLGAIKHHKAA